MDIEAHEIYALKGNERIAIKEKKSSKAPLLTKYEH
jgi:hypothetical protein